MAGADAAAEADGAVAPRRPPAPRLSCRGAGAQRPGGGCGALQEWTEVLSWRQRTRRTGGKDWGSVSRDGLECEEPEEMKANTLQQLGYEPSDPSPLAWTCRRKTAIGSRLQLHCQLLRLAVLSGRPPGRARMPIGTSGSRASADSEFGDARVSKCTNGWSWRQQLGGKACGECISNCLD